MNYNCVDTKGVQFLSELPRNVSKNMLYKLLSLRQVYCEIGNA